MARLAFTWVLPVFAAFTRQTQRASLRCGSPQKVEQGAVEGLGLLEEREVAALGNQHQPRAGDELHEFLHVVLPDDLVVVSIEHERGQLDGGDLRSFVVRLRAHIGRSAACRPL